ncbi:uroporphyrinogen-III synthase [Brevundimonas terrae]|uniref:Uroporphyrinogen-III synthase n=1 Tax=Brevundimonas terrae TaxID=363631 RepID=A0ABP3HVD3_9CAUL|nr:uroporphyrinogen-III synthase [Brevundimonas terrae]NIJ25880.1 uroporphyrinogen-III synthase [Brevundimonas terrae]
MSLPPRVWITRTQPRADITARHVRDLGWEPVVAPLLEVRAITGAMTTAPSPGLVTAVALTSPNTIKAIGSDLLAYRHLPVFAVGDTTAEAARLAGLTDVRSAKGDIQALARLIARDIPTGTVFAPGAKEPAGDLPALLPAHRVIRLPVYETVDTGIEAPQDIAAILIHSPRAARLLRTRNLGQATLAVTISEAASTPLNGHFNGEIRTSPTPDEEGVLTTLGNSPSPV